MKTRRLDITDAAFADLAGDLLRGGSSIRFEARGLSMQPFLRDGDVVTVRPVQAAGFRVGDTVFYVNRAGRAILHRLLGVSRAPGGEPWLLARGDALRCLEERVPPSALLGVLSEARRGERVLRVSSPFYRVRARLWQALPWPRRLLAFLHRSIVPRGPRADEP